MPLACTCSSPTIILFISAGIINIELETGKDSKCLNASGKSCSSHEEASEAIVLLNDTRFLDNKVKKGAATVAIPSLSLLEVCCGNVSTCIRASSMEQTACSLNDKPKDQSNCTGFEPDYSCSPSTNMVVSLLSNEPAASAQELEGINVDFQDNLGQDVAVEGTLFVHLVNENSAQLSGQPTEGIYVTKETVLQGLELRGKPGMYGLVFTFLPKEDVELNKLVENINITLRDCTIGEVSRDEGRICEMCDTNSYSFDPTLSSCLQCPKYAECNASTLTPLDGYWHFDSQSPVIHKCINKIACTRTDRSKDLANKAKHAVDALTSQLSYPQCSKVFCFLVLFHETCFRFISWFDCDGDMLNKANQILYCFQGYDGVLCASCFSGYGKMESHQCSKCQEGFLTVLYVLGSMLVMAALSAVLLAGGKKYKKMISAGTLGSPHDAQLRNTMEETENRESNNKSSVSNILKVRYACGPDSCGNAESMTLHLRICN